MTCRQRLWLLAGLCVILTVIPLLGKYAIGPGGLEGAFTGGTVERGAHGGPAGGAGGHAGRAVGGLPAAGGLCD